MNYGPPGYYAPPPPPPKLSPIDIIVPLALSLACGFGGFAWGLIRLAQGHNRPGMAAIGVNACVIAVGFAVWLIGFVLLAGVMHSVPTPPH